MSDRSSSAGSWDDLANAEFRRVPGDATPSHADHHHHPRAADALRADLDAARADIDRLAADASEARDASGRAEAARAGLEEELRATRAALQAAKSHQAQAEAQLEAHHASAAAADSEAAEQLAAERATSAALRETHRKELAAAEAAAAAAEAEARRLEDALAESRAALSAAEGRCRELELQLQVQAVDRLEAEERKARAAADAVTEAKDARDVARFLQKEAEEFKAKTEAMRLRLTQVVGERDNALVQRDEARREAAEFRHAIKSQADIGQLDRETPANFVTRALAAQHRAIRRSVLEEQSHTQRRGTPSSTNSDSPPAAVVAAAQANQSPPRDGTLSDDSDNGAESNANATLRMQFHAPRRDAGASLPAHFSSGVSLQELSEAVRHSPHLLNGAVFHAFFAGRGKLKLIRAKSQPVRDAIVYETLVGSRVHVRGRLSTVVNVDAEEVEAFVIEVLSVRVPRNSVTVTLALE